MSTHCSIAKLESALAGNLPAEDEVSLHRHLDACEECNAALEQLAGGDQWRREAASMLAEDELDVAAPGREEWSEADFIVEQLEPADDPEVLGRLGGYEVLSIIGRGGMGVVLKAFDSELKRTVAIKVLAPHLAHSSLARKRFAREAQAAAAVVHPHVQAIHQVQAGGRLPFLVMPLVAGESLAERLAAQGTLELKELLRIGMQAAAGLAAAHEQGLVHRDVKPANILLEKGVERAVLTDFGLARAADDVALTRWGIVAGTPQYMSPEQARGEPLDGRSDLFSLGCVLYEMATGVSPFRAESLMATMRRLVDDRPQALASLNPELPPWFIAVVDRLLEKDPSRRLQSAKEVSELLEGCLAHVQQPAKTPLPAGLPRASRPPAWRALSMAMLVIAGTSGLAYFMFFGEPPQKNAKEKDPGAAAVESKPAFGPVMERVLPYGVPCEQQYFQFKKGEVFTVGRGPATSREERDQDWKKVEDAGGVDISLGSNVGIQLVGEGCIFSQDFGNLRWETFTAEQVVKGMRRVNFSFGVIEPRKDEMPATYLFKTSRGEVGILQIQGIVDDPRGIGQLRGMKFRYKLVQANGPPPNPIAKANTTMPTRLHNFPTREGVKTIACSPGGRWIAIANGNPSFPLPEGWKRSVEILDDEGGTVATLPVTTAEEDAILAATEGLPHFEVGPLAFSPDGKLLAVGTAMGQVKLYDLRGLEVVRTLDDEKSKLAEKTTPERLKSLKRAMGAVGSLAFSPDGRLLAMTGSSFEDVARNWGGQRLLGRLATGPGRLLIWDLKTGALLHDLIGHSHANAVAFSADGTLLASAGRWESGNDHGNGVLVWNPQTGAKLRSIVIEANGGTHAVAFSPNKKLVAIGSRHFDKENDTSSTSIGVAYPMSGVIQWQRTIPGWANPKAFSPDGKSVAVQCGGASIQFFDAETGVTKQEIRPADSDPPGRWTDFVLSPAGRVIVGGAAADNSGSVSVWE